MNAPDTPFLDRWYMRALAILTMMAVTAVVGWEMLNVFDKASRQIQHDIRTHEKWEQPNG